MRDTSNGGQEVALATAPKRVLLQFRVIAHAVRSHAKHLQPKPTVGDRKLLALSSIAGTPGMGVNRLARFLGVRQPTASQVVKALAALQFVHVQGDADDRRAVCIHASATGLAILRSLPADFDFGDRLPQALERLDPNALSNLESGLSEVLEALSRLRRVTRASVKATGPSGPRAATK